MGRCLTWIELYILFRISGNDKPLSTKPRTIGDKARQAVSLDLQFKHFKNNVRCICERALVGGIDGTRFQPVTIKHDNLLNVGIEGKQPAVGFNVSISEHTQKQMTRALLSLGRDMSQERINQFVDGENPTYYKAGPICFKGKVGWDTRLANYTGSLEQLNPAFNSIDSCVEERRRLMFVVQCPSCHKQSSIQHYKFQCDDLDAKIERREC